ncbi:MAG: hypothetical protein ACRDKI_04145 [Solirubrobacterales bacterium]
MQTSSRLVARSATLVVASFIALLVLAGSASALVKPTISTTLSDLQLGAHPDLTVNMNFSYGATGTVGSPAYEDPATYPQPSDFRESVNHLVVNTPPGLVGNPNAVPYADRCDISVFQTGTCPGTATIGTFSIATLLLPLDTPPDPGDGGVPIAIPQIGAGAFTKVSLLKTDPEIPAKIGVTVQPPFGFQRILTIMEIAPDTAGDLHLRTVTPDGIDHVLRAGPASSSPPPGDPLANFRVDSMQLTFEGVLANGNAFMTNSTNCKKWTSSIFADATYVNDNLDSDPLATGANNYRAGNLATLTPDCTNQLDVPFPIVGTTKISSNARDVSPDFDFTVTDPGVQANGQASSTPRKVVTVVPASINVDVQQLSRICTDADFKADTCPASTKVGTVAIDTPLIAAGLSGDVYLVRNPNKTPLPDLAMQIRGAIHFTQRGTNRYINTNQIETTFDNIPEVGFSRLNVHLFGGPNGLLRTLGCPTSNKQPQDGSFTYNFTGYTGATASSTTKLNALNCFGIQKLRSFGCVFNLLRFQPTYTSRARIRRVVLIVDGKKTSTAKRAPFGFKVPAKRFKKGKHKIVLKATYDDGTVSVKKSFFKRC